MTTRNARDVLKDISARQDASAARAKALGARKRWFRIENAITTAAGTTRAKVYLYDPIGGWFGVTPGDFVRELDELDVDELELHINSPGGSVFDGIAIMNALRHHDARVIGYVDGLAASAASFIAVGGCDELVMSAHSELMIHDAWGLCVGSAEDMAKMAEDLDRISDNIASVYARKAGGTTTGWRDIMREERWYSDEEAVTAGLADRLDASDEDDEGDEPENRWGRHIFASLTSEHPVASASRVPSPVASASGDTTQEGAAVLNETQLTNLRQKLGVADDADGDTIVAALEEALQEQATEEQPAAGKTTIPEGMSLLDTATLDALREDATAGREARTEQQTAHRKGLVAAAMRDGRISAARREHWENALAADPGAADTLASLTAGLIPLEERGHAGQGPTSTDAKQDLYDQLYGNGTAGDRDDTKEAS